MTYDEIEEAKTLLDSVDKAVYIIHLGSERLRRISELLELALDCARECPCANQQL